MSIQTTSECACVADLMGTRILVGSEPWLGPQSEAAFTLCANVTGIVRGGRKAFACGASGQYLAVFRPSAAKKQLTLCEVDVVLADPDPAPQPQPQPAAVRRSLLKAGRRRLRAAAVAAQQPQQR